MAPDPPRATDPIAALPQRVFVIGQSGSGKTTLARRLAAALNVAAHDLDLVVREGGGNGPLRRAELRDADLARIATSPGWVVEGIHLEGTQPLMDAADLIVWLDHISWWRSGWRMTRRFVGGAVTEVRRQRGWRRFLRFRDYARHLGELVRAIPQARGYARGDDSRGAITRAAVARRLAGYGDKVVRITQSGQIDELVTRLRPAAARPR